MYRFVCLSEFVFIVFEIMILIVTLFDLLYYSFNLYFIYNKLIYLQTFAITFLFS